MRDGGLLVRIWPCNAVPIPPVGKTDSQGVNNQACNDARKGAPPTCGRALPFGSFTLQWASILLRALMLRHWLALVLAAHFRLFVPCPRS